MKYSRKNLEAGKIEVTATLAPEEIAKNHVAAIRQLSRNLKVAGFRKGHVPAAVAEKNLDPRRINDAEITESINAALSEIMAQEKLQILAQPNIEVTKFVPGQILEFVAKIEIIPEIKLADPKKLAAKREKVEISDEQIDEVLTRLRQNDAEKIDVSRPAQNGDEVVIDFTGILDGEKFDGGKATDYHLVLGSKSFIPGFEDGIVGHKTGENFDLEITFPKDYAAKNLAGQKTIFKINLKSVHEVKLPELDDAFAKKIAPDFATIDDLKNDIRRELTKRAEFEAQRKFEDELLAELAEKSKIDAPEIMVHQQIHAAEQEFSQNLAYRGLTLEKYLEQEKISREDWEKNELRPAAEKRVKSSLALSQLSRDLDIQVSDAEITAQQEKIMAQYNDPKLRESFANDDAKRRIAQDMIAGKTLAKLAELNEKK